MVTKKLLIIVAFITLLGITSSSALADPFFPPEVIYASGDTCSFTWVDDDFNPVTLTGVGKWYRMHSTLHVRYSCYTQIDFSDPGIASLDQVCPVVPSFCSHGYSSFHMDEKDGLSCLSYGYTITSSIKVANTGKVNISCLFHMPIIIP